MKQLTYLLCFYLIALTVLPSIRVIKMHFADESSCHRMSLENTDTPECDRGKIIMNLSFNPAHFFQSILFSQSEMPSLKEVDKESNVTYKKVFISEHKFFIWKPPRVS